MLAAVGACLALTARAQTSAPSFSCANVTSAVNKLICASPDLAALDRALAAQFLDIMNQGGIDQKALRAEEDRWVATTLKTCSTHDCVAAAYRDRMAALLEAGKRAASPAAYGETRPFPAPDDVWADAAAHIGKSCAPYVYRKSPFADYTPAKGFLPIIQFPNATVAPLEKNGARFAFVFAWPTGDAGKCVVADVVALPTAAVANQFLWCSVDDSSADLTSGFGMRAPGGRLAAFWTVGIIAPDKTPHAHRAPIDTLGWSGRIRCNEPESGE